MVVQRRTQEQRRSESEKALLDAAAELIAERGVIQASLAEIAERAGFSRGLPSHHFGTKDVLVDRLLRRCQDRFAAKLAAAEGKSGLDAVLASVDAYVGHFEDPSVDARALVVMWGASFPSAATMTAMRAANERSIERLVEDIERGQVDGTISRAIDPRVFAATLLALLRGLAGQRLADPDRVPIEGIRVECRRIVFAALGAR